MRASRSFGVVLHAKRRYVNAAQPLNHVVVQAHMTYLGATERRIDLSLERRRNSESMIVCGDGNAPGAQILYRLIDAAMSEVKFLGF